MRLKALLRLESGGRILAAGRVPSKVKDPAAGIDNATLF